MENKAKNKKQTFAMCLTDKKIAIYNKYIKLTKKINRSIWVTDQEELAHTIASESMVFANICGSIRDFTAWCSVWCLIGFRSRTTNTNVVLKELDYVTSREDGDFYTACPKEFKDDYESITKALMAALKDIDRRKKTLSNKDLVSLLIWAAQVSLEVGINSRLELDRDLDKFISLFQ